MKYVYALVVFVVGEFIALFIFAAVKRLLGPPPDSPALKASTARGILERVVLYTGLLYGFPQILIAFGALKLGTRLHEDQGSEISNNYFLVGNLISMFLAMLYAAIARCF
jgi:hypothetical protein